MKRININLPDALEKKLREHAILSGVPVSSFVKMALMDYIKQTEFLKGLDFLKDYQMAELLGAQKQKEEKDEDDPG